MALTQQFVSDRIIFQTDLVVAGDNRASVTEQTIGLLPAIDLTDANIWLQGSYSDIANKRIIYATYDGSIVTVTDTTSYDNVVEYDAAAEQLYIGKTQGVVLVTPLILSEDIYTATQIEALKQVIKGLSGASTDLFLLNEDIRSISYDANAHLLWLVDAAGNALAYDILHQEFLWQNQSTGVGTGTTIAASDGMAAIGGTTKSILDTIGYVSISDVLPPKPASGLEINGDIGRLIFSWSGDADWDRFTLEVRDQDGTTILTKENLEGEQYTLAGVKELRSKIAKTAEDASNYYEARITTYDEAGNAAATDWLPLIEANPGAGESINTDLSSYRAATGQAIPSTAVLNGTFSTTGGTDGDASISFDLSGWSADEKKQVERIIVERWKLGAGDDATDPVNDLEAAELYPVAELPNEAEGGFPNLPETYYDRNLLELDTNWNASSSPTQQFAYRIKTITWDGRVQYSDFDTAVTVTDTTGPDISGATVDSDTDYGRVILRIEDVLNMPEGKYLVLRGPAGTDFSDLNGSNAGTAYEVVKPIPSAYGINDGKITFEDLAWSAVTGYIPANKTNLDASLYGHTADYRFVGVDKFGNRVQQGDADWDGYTVTVTDLGPQWEPMQLQVPESALASAHFQGNFITDQGDGPTAMPVISFREVQKFGQALCVEAATTNLMGAFNGQELSASPADDVFDGSDSDHTLLNNATHWLQYWGDGTVTVTGSVSGQLGTATEGSPISFTPDGAETVTISYSNTTEKDRVQLEEAAHPTNFTAYARDAGAFDLDIKNLRTAASAGTLTIMARVTPTEVDWDSSTDKAGTDSKHDYILMWGSPISNGFTLINNRTSGAIELRAYNGATNLIQYSRDSSFTGKSAHWIGLQLDTNTNKVYLIVDGVRQGNTALSNLTVPSDDHLACYRSGYNAGFAFHELFADNAVWGAERLRLLEEVDLPLLNERPPVRFPAILEAFDLEKNIYVPASTDDLIPPAGSYVTVTNGSAVITLNGTGVDATKMFNAGQEIGIYRDPDNPQSERVLEIQSIDTTTQMTATENWTDASIGSDPGAVNYRNYTTRMITGSVQANKTPKKVTRFEAT